MDALKEAIINAIKFNSQNTYKSHLRQYIMWSMERLSNPLTFPTPYTLVASWMLDSARNGITPVTLRGYIAAIKWMNDIVGYEGPNGLGWNTQHFLIRRIRQNASLEFKNYIIKDTTATALTQSESIPS